MRVVEPHQFKSLPRRRRGKRWLVLFYIPVLGLTAFATWLFLSSRVRPIDNTAPSLNAPTAVPVTPPANNKLKQFSGPQFKAIYLSMSYPNTQDFNEPPPITGNTEADNRIRRMAEARGYRLTSIPTQAIVKINEPRLDDDDLLQPMAAKNWVELKAAAHKAGYPLTLVSAYRSPEYQRNLFNTRLNAGGVTPQQIASAQADAVVEATLLQAALPGYSRHHTGYTIDMWCDDNSANFLSSRCYKWISANNYERAKEYGWIPSYPEGVQEQGPEPEPWEYVWVGRERLVE